METLLTHVLERKVMWISFFLFAGCALHDESMAPENLDGSSAVQAISECSSGDRVARAKVTPLYGAAGNVLPEIELTGENGIFTAHLGGSNEVPPSGARGQGQVVFRLNEEGTALDYILNVANTKNITQAHIHCGEPGVNGPVVVFLFGLEPAGVNQNGVLAEGTITAENLIPRDSSAACVGGVNSFEALLERIRNGGAYVNVHTLAFPGGEIRGQIKQ